MQQHNDKETAFSKIHTSMKQQLGAEVQVNIDFAPTQKFEYKVNVW